MKSVIWSLLLLVRDVLLDLFTQAEMRAGIRSYVRAWFSLDD